MGIGGVVWELVPLLLYKLKPRECWVLFSFGFAISPWSLFCLFSLFRFFIHFVFSSLHG